MLRAAQWLKQDGNGLQITKRREKTVSASDTNISVVYTLPVKLYGSLFHSNIYFRNLKKKILNK